MPEAHSKPPADAKPDAKPPAKPETKPEAKPAAPAAPSAASQAITGLAGRVLRRLLTLPSSEHPISLNPLRIGFDLSSRLWGGAEKISGAIARAVVIPTRWVVKVVLSPFR